MTALLSVAGLTCRFGRLLALDRVDLELHEGERRAVIGPNGAGKTTLVNAVTGVVRPSRGRVFLASRDVTAAGPGWRARSGVARTFQTPALAGSLTALDNVILGLRPERQPGRWWSGGPGWRGSGRERARERARRALRTLDQLGIGGLAGTPAGRLAHGQRRLLEIAVALAARPRLLLLDEPAAGLTDADLPQLLAVLDRLSDRVTVLLVEHHLDVVTAVADTVTVLHQGRVLATDKPAVIATHPEVSEVYLGKVAGPC
jgi:branched-chain amino acid transport system ATP-binding protein